MASSAPPTLCGLGKIPQELCIVALSLLVATWSAAFSRAYVRGYMLRSFGWDDWTLIPAQLCYTVQCAYLISMASVEMNPEDNSSIQSIAQLVTISLGLFFLRIITQKWQRNVIYAGITINTTFGLAYFGLCTFGCGDPSEYLLRTTLGQCISVKNVVIPASYIFTALNAVMDFTMALLPISTIWHLKMPRITKFWAYLLMLLGASGSVVSLIRFAFVESLEPGPEFFKDTGKLAFYSHIEPGVGIVAVCVATLRPLFRQCLEGAKSVSSTQKSRGPSGKRTSITGTSGVQLTSMKTNRRPRDGFNTFEDDSDEMETHWSNEHGIGVKTDFRIESHATKVGSHDVEQGRGPSFPQPPSLPPSQPLSRPHSSVRMPKKIVPGGYF
ncbi:unnamed protein product [Aureobasidium vineae]|uniref:Rhodopsin domain-containing protein n=1 Tax=Aureobasidium vineae TaxID=2773715 RepID=A0A9N8JDZ4_9PEZI|nr:unnamed protein product [Aureobasidium vineae]